MPRPLRTALLFACAALLCAAAHAQPPAPPRLTATNSFEFSFVDTAGNSESRSFQFGDTLNLKFLEIYSWTSKGNAFLSKFQETTTSEWYNAETRLDRKMNERIFVFGAFNWERNRFFGLKRRFNEIFGVGYTFLNTPRQQLSAELAVSNLDEIQMDGFRHQVLQRRFGANYSLKIAKEAQLREELEAYHDFQRSRNPRFKSVTSLNVPITPRVGVRVAYTFLFVDKPPPRIKKEDRIFSSGFYVRF